MHRRLKPSFRVTVAWVLGALLTRPSRLERLGLGAEAPAERGLSRKHPILQSGWSRTQAVGAGRFRYLRLGWLAAVWLGWLLGIFSCWAPDPGFPATWRQRGGARTG